MLGGVVENMTQQASATSSAAVRRQNVKTPKTPRELIHSIDTPDSDQLLVRE
jgi:hypothetical protein